MPETLAFDRGKVEEAVERGADILEELADELYAARLDFEIKEAEWNRINLIHQAEIAINKDEWGTTSENTRAGLTLKTHQNEDVYLNYVAAKATWNALDKRHKALAEAVNARQSLLRRQS